MRVCRSPSVLCCLLAPLLSSSVLFVVWCVWCFGRPPLSASPLDGRFLVGWLRVVFCSSFASIPRIPPCIIALSFHPGYNWSHVFVTKDSSDRPQGEALPVISADLTSELLHCLSTLPWPLAKITIDMEKPSQWVSKLCRLYFADEYAKRTVGLPSRRHVPDIAGALRTGGVAFHCPPLSPPI